MPKTDIDLVKSQDVYKIFEDKILYAIEDVEKGSLRTIENLEKAHVHIIEDEVRTILQVLNRNNNPVLEN